MKALLLQFLLISAAVAAPIETINAPVVKAGDGWTYRITTEKTTSTPAWNQTHDVLKVTRVTSSSIYVTVHQDGSTQAPKELFFGSDWSRARDVDGQETVVNKPLSFPLTVGKAWKLEYTDEHPSNNQHKSEKWTEQFTVIGYEQVEVPAGKFQALKIECEGHWTAEIAPGKTVVQGAQTNAGGVSMSTQVANTAAGTKSGRTYKAFWYVPAVKRWVKSVEEYYSSGGVRTESYTGELESFEAAL